MGAREQKANYPKSSEQARPSLGGQVGPHGDTHRNSHETWLPSGRCDYGREAVLTTQPPEPNSPQQLAEGTSCRCVSHGERGPGRKGGSERKGQGVEGGQKEGKKEVREGRRMAVVAALGCITTGGITRPLNLTESQLHHL